MEFSPRAAHPQWQCQSLEHWPTLAAILKFLLSHSGRQRLSRMVGNNNNNNNNSNNNSSINLFNNNNNRKEAIENPDGAIDGGDVTDGGSDDVISPDASISAIQ